MDQKTLIPISILVAGVLIAGAVFYSNSQPGEGTGNEHNAMETENSGAASIGIREVDESDWIKGDVSAPVKLVEYSDTECPFCARLHETMNEVIAEYDGSEFAWVYRHLPLTQIHPTAGIQGNALECAGELGGNDAFWAYTDQLYREALAGSAVRLDRLPGIATDNGLDQGAFVACLDEGRHEDDVQQDADDAVQSAGHLGGRVGTPYSVLVSEEGAFNAAALEAMQGIAAQYNRPGQTVIAISEDNARASISGALPKEMWNAILDAALEK